MMIEIVKCDKCGTEFDPDIGFFIVDLVAHSTDTKIVGVVIKSTKYNKFAVVDDRVITKSFDICGLTCLTKFLGEKL